MEEIITMDNEGLIMGNYDEFDETIRLSKRTYKQLPLWPE